MKLFVAFTENYMTSECRMQLYLIRTFMQINLWFVHAMASLYIII